MLPLRPILPALLLATLLVARTGHAAPILVESPAYTTLPTSPGSGLNGAFVRTGKTITNITSAYSALASQAPSATFISSKIDYPRGTTAIVSSATTSLSTFLGPDWSTRSLTSIDSPATTYSVWRFTGYIRIDAPQTINFSVASDDGMRLTIGGVVISEFTGQRAMAASSSSAQFASAGLYSVDLTYFNNTGSNGIEWQSSLPGGSVASANISGMTGILATQYLYTQQDLLNMQGLSGNVGSIPDPAGSAVAAPLAFAFAARRRR
jgi:hypothetical protein